jgi:hypothetical protein
LLEDSRPTYLRVVAASDASGLRSGRAGLVERVGARRWFTVAIVLAVVAAARAFAFYWDVYRTQMQADMFRDRLVAERAWNEYMCHELRGKIATDEFIAELYADQC